MANAVVNKQKFLIHSKVYSKDEIKKYRLNIPAGVAVTTDTFFGSQGYDKYVRNGHGVDQDSKPELLDDLSVEEEREIRQSVQRGYAGLGYVSDEHGNATNLDRILKELDVSEGNDSEEEWIRSPFTISSFGRLDDDELKVQMTDIMREHFTKAGNLVWFPIVSIENYQIAKDLELFKDEDYEDVINESLPRWFRSVGLDPDNMLWTVDYHNNTDNPHLHYIFLEKDQTRTKGIFRQSDLDNLKEQFYASAARRARQIKQTRDGIDYSMENNPELYGAHKLMDEANAHIRQNVDDFLSKKMDQKIENDIYSLFKKIDAADRNKGRLTMGSYNMAPFKNDVMKIVDEILEHPQNAQLYEDAKSEWEKLDRMTKGEVMDNPDRYQRSEDEKLRTYIGNSVLQLKKDFDSARGYHFMNDSGFSKIRELKAKIEPYRMSRNYSLDSGLYEQEKGYPKPGVGIKFKDPDLGLKFNELFKSADFSHAGIKYSGTENGNACLILFDNVDADDSDLIGIPRDFCRVVANSIQDYLSDASDYQDYYKTCETIKTLAVQNDYHDAEKIMLNTIYSHRDQPDNPHYLDSKDKDLYKSYVKDRTSINRAAAVSSGSYNQTPNNNAISFMPGVFDGFALLMKSAGRNRAAQETKHEAENFWENERKKEAAERRKEEMEKGYGIDI